MIYVFSGSDRTKISNEIKKILGEDYEVFDGAGLGTADLVNIFTGSSLFVAERKILIKDLNPARGEGEKGFDPFEALLELPETIHTIVIWETNKSTKKTYKDFVKKFNVKEQKIDQVESFDSRRVFEIYDLALRNGVAAVKMLEQIEDQNDPYMFVGLLVSQAVKKFQYNQGTKEKRALKELSKLDLQMKTSTIQPWILVKSFLLQLSQL